MEQEHEQTEGEEYPHGRGYGHDYMRGGEVFGGYGYAEREEYARPRGELQHDHDDTEFDGDDEAQPVDRFPQDERAGGWEIPRDLNGGSRSSGGALS